jgi:hypothetical protein
VHVDILALGREFEAAVLDLALHRVEPIEDGAAIRLGQNPLRHQHVTMGPAAGDVLPVEPPVEIDGGVDAGHDLGGGAGKASAPHRVGSGGVGSGGGRGAGWLVGPFFGHTC